MTSSVGGTSTGLPSEIVDWPMIIDGQRVAAVDDGWLTVTDPGTGRVFARVPQASAEQLDDAVSAARRSFEDGRWRAKSGDERSKILWRVATLIDEYMPELADLETRNQGMPVHIAAAHVLPSVSRTFRYYAGAIERIEGRAVDLPGPGARTFHGYTRLEPVGVAGLIVPWNAPMVSLSWKLAPALAAGCSVVVKPAEQTPLTALRVAELCDEAGIPPGVVNVVTGVGEVTGAALAAHPDVDKVSFTGSTAAGRSIIRGASGNLKKLSLELGGKSPVVVFPDADLQRAIPGAAAAIFTNSGQVCTAGSRLLVHADVKDQVVEGLARAARAVPQGYRTDTGVQIGPIISAEQRIRIHGYVTGGASDGAEIITGGVIPEGDGFFYPPTVVDGVDPAMTIAREEIFGPVIAVMPFDDEEQAVALANDTDFGLAGSIWTESIDRAHRVARRLRAGRVGINVHASPDVLMPTGGYRQSGWGRELGPDGLAAYLEVTSVYTTVDGA